MGQLNTRVPLVGKVPPWRQPPKPVDPDAPKPFAWLRDLEGDDVAAGDDRGRGRRSRPPPGSATIRWRRGRRSGVVARPGTRAGPGDTPASVAWLRAGKGTGYAAERDRLVRAGTGGGRAAIDPESGQVEPPRARHDRGRAALSAGRTAGIRRPRRPATMGRGGSAGPVVGRSDRAGGAAAGPRRLDGRAQPLGALARVLRSDRWLPAPSLDPQRRHARDGRAAHRHRAAGAGDDAGSGRRPVRQARRRDAQADQARPARARDARRDGRDAPAHRARLRRVHRSRSAAGGRAGGLRDAPGRRHGRGLPGREPGADADAAEVTPGEPRRPRGRGRDHPARADPGQRRPPVPAAQAGAGARDVPPPDPGARAQGLDGRDPLPGAGHAHRHRGRGVQPGRERRVPPGDGDVALDPGDGEAPSAVRGGRPPPARA